MNIRAECGFIKPGFNFYPLRDYKTSIGFVYMGRDRVVRWYRYAPHVNKFYIGIK